ncbi:MAG: hypothetical protein IPG12_08245 [Saprospiraceae bacterium]|nr:hypothetical protein [Saprospiraceae bacterium]
MRLLIIVFFFSSQYLYGQISFFEDFEKYQPNFYLVQQSLNWKTYHDNYKIEEDVYVDSINYHSGKNSISFSSGLNLAGPQDIILPFKYPMTNGTLHLEFWLFIEKGKGAYWNIQKKVDNKSMPVIQVFYDSVGGFEINSGIGNGINFIKGAYPQGEWFKMSLDLDIIKKEWSFSINDKYIGNCHQNFSSIVSLNFYPFLYLGRTKFFIDDVFYTYSGVEKYQTDISINEIISLSKGLANYKQSFDLIVESLGMDTLNSIEIKVKNDIGLINILNINKINIIPGSNFKLHFPDAITLHEGVNMIDVLISSINGKMDENISNNSIQFKVIGIKPGENKKVLNETIVSTWCGWSPRGYTFLDSLNAKYSDYSVGLQIHNQDGLSDRGYDSVF